MWNLCFFAAAAIFLFSIGFVTLQSMGVICRKRRLNPLAVLFVGVIITSVILFIPLYINNLAETSCGPVETALLSVHNMIRLFVVDGEFGFIADNMGGIPEWMVPCYNLFFAVLFIFAPLLTFGAVLSFFSNVSAGRRYFFNRNKSLCIFSELNERSVILAESLLEADKKRFLIFTDVSDEEGEAVNELKSRAKNMGAVCFKTDIAELYYFKSRKNKLEMFVIGDDESENIKHGLKLIEKYKSTPDSNLYVFSTNPVADILITGALNSAGEECDGKPIELKVRCVNEVRSLIYRNLYDRGYESVFEGLQQDENGIKRINAVVLGMGSCGTEMAKALAWVGQMDGYEITVSCFDENKKAAEKFASLCPELMAYSGKSIKGEARYVLNVYSDSDVTSRSFDEQILGLSGLTYVFVALGTDEKSIAAAIKMRTLASKRGWIPVIQAVVRDNDKKAALADIKNYKGKPYGIEVVGDMETSYSADVILESDIETAGKMRHLKYAPDDERSFWLYSYNYRSSIASAIHHKLKCKCGIAGAEKKPCDRNEGELWALRELEHRRWNAYMRSEGYEWAEKRDDMAKTHHLLVPFDKLSLEEQEKDDD